MGEQYRHLLISCDKMNTPSAGEVCEFLSQMSELGVVPGQPDIVLRVPSGKTQEYPNPFTGGTFAVEIKNRTQFKTLEELECVALKQRDFEVELSGTGHPKLPPLEIKDFDGTYYLGITCFVSSFLRSTSTESYGEPCKTASTVGGFQHPDSNKLIEIPEAGAARFWIEFELGKFLAPDIAECNLELLHPTIVETAEEIFGGCFVQGCGWG